MIDPERLVELRADDLADLLLTGVTATVVTLGTGRSETGGFNGTPADGATYPCMMQTEAQEQQGTSGGGGRVQSSVRFYCVLPWDAVIPQRGSLRIESPVEPDTVWQIVDSNVSETNRFALKVEVMKAT